MLLEWCRYSESPSWYMLQFPGWTLYSQFSRSCDVLLTHSGSGITLWCVFLFCFSGGLVVGWFFFLLKFVGSFFSMVICKTFGSFFVVSVKALLGQSVLYWGENKSRVPQVQNIIMSWSSSPECEEILASFTTVWHDDKIRIQFWWNASQNPLLLS